MPSEPDPCIGLNARKLSPLALSASHLSLSESKDGFFIKAPYLTGLRIGIKRPRMPDLLSSSVASLADPAAVKLSTTASVRPD